MPRIYAGIIGPLAFLIALTRGAVRGGSVESTLFAAWCGLIAFSAVGYLVGWLAGSTIDESVAASVAGELAAHETSDKPEDAEPAT